MRGYKTFKVTVLVRAETADDAVKEVGYRLTTHEICRLRDHGIELEVEEVNG